MSSAASIAYYGLHSLVWGLALAWVVFACTKGYGGGQKKFAIHVLTYAIHWSGEKFCYFCESFLYTTILSMTDRCGLYLKTATPNFKYNMKIEVLFIYACLCRRLRQHLPLMGRIFSLEQGHLRRVPGALLSHYRLHHPRQISDAVQQFLHGEVIQIEKMCRFLRFKR